VAAAFGVPVVTLFGPTDPRWTTLPEGGAAHEEVVADPTLPVEMMADDHPERCRIERIGVERVNEAVDRVLA
jgi:ADP-heptose:LPS heptosyltransferase